MGLKDMIIRASQQYYTDGTSEVSDEKFDQMLEELKEQEPNSELLTQVGHGYQVSEDTTPGKKLQHFYGQAGSLVKFHNWKECPTDLKKVNPVYASLKLDGISIVLYYENGKLTNALTRGDGTTGVDVIDKVIKVNPRLQDIHEESFTGAVRGEILMSFENFDIYKIDHPEAKNPRNTTAGLIGSKEVSDDLKYLAIVVYNIIGCTSDTLHNDASGMLVTYDAMFDWLRLHFQDVAPMKEVIWNEENLDTVVSQLQEAWYGKYPADGIVVTSRYAQVHDHSLILNRREIVRNAAAFKYRAESAITKVVRVEWNLSKTKYLVPRVQFEEVSLSGTSVSWAHGDNARNILDKRIDEGAIVEVMKRGEIIPHIEQVISPAPKVNLPKVCPSCGAELVWNGMHLSCPNSECQDAAVKDVLIWCNIIAPYFGLGDLLKIKFLSDLLGADNISIESIYQHGMLEESETPSIQYNDFKKMFNMLFTNKVTLVEALKAINIPRLGDVNTTKLAKYPELVKKLISGDEVIFTEEHLKVIGNANCAAIKENADKFKRLSYILANIDFSVVSSDIEIKGKVAITGKLSVKRDDFEQELREHGYLPASSVTKDTLFLITDDPSSNSSKNKNAEKFGVPKISEQEFRKIYLS